MTVIVAHTCPKYDWHKALIFSRTFTSSYDKRIRFSDNERLYVVLHLISILSNLAWYSTLSHCNHFEVYPSVVLAVTIDELSSQLDFAACIVVFSRKGHWYLIYVDRVPENDLLVVEGGCKASSKLNFLVIPHIFLQWQYLRFWQSETASLPLLMQNGIM